MQLGPRTRGEHELIAIVPRRLRISTPVAIQSSMSWPEPIVLRCPEARLEPLTQTHLGDLVESVRDGELWNLWYTTIPRPENMSAEIDRRLRLQADGSMLPFAVIESRTNRAVGMTTYMNVDAENRRLEIGRASCRERVLRLV